MEIILNSKFFGSLSVEDLGRKVIELGYDGVDVNVREGHPVNPGNAVVALKVAVSRWQEMGLTCPLATAPVDMVDPGSTDAATLYEACAEAGVPRLKLGFWKYAPGDDYWDTVARARGSLEGFAGLSQETNVQTCYQVHSGPNLGSNCAGLMHLIRGFDPRLVGAYPDVGHMALDGEDWDMGFSMVAEYLSIIGAKDAHHAPRKEGELPRYTPKFVKLGDGSIDWDRCVRRTAPRGLRRADFGAHGVRLRRVGHPAGRLCGLHAPQSRGVGGGRRGIPEAGPRQGSDAGQVGLTRRCSRMLPGD